MATSTERTVRDTIIAAIQGIAQTDLAFDMKNGNVREYPIEFHADERTHEYLTAQVGGKNIGRAWAVDVRGAEEPYAMNTIQKRTYTIRLIGYYEKGFDGQNYVTLIDHCRKVHQAFKNLQNNISGTVTRIASETPFAITIQDDERVGRLLVAEAVITAERTNPDY